MLSWNNLLALNLDFGQFLKVAEMVTDGRRCFLHFCTSVNHLRRKSEILDQPYHLYITYHILEQPSHSVGCPLQESTWWHSKPPLTGHLNTYTIREEKMRKVLIYLFSLEPHQFPNTEDPSGRRGRNPWGEDGSGLFETCSGSPRMLTWIVQALLRVSSGFEKLVVTPKLSGLP